MENTVKMLEQGSITVALPKDDRLHAICNLASTVNNLSKVLLDTDIKVNISNCVITHAKQNGINVNTLKNSNTLSEIKPKLSNNIIVQREQNENNQDK